MPTTLQEYRKEARRWKRKYLRLKMQGYGRSGSSNSTSNSTDEKLNSDDELIDELNRVKTEDERVKIARLYALANKLGVKIGG